MILCVDVALWAIAAVGGPAAIATRGTANRPRTHRSAGNWLKSLVQNLLDLIAELPGTKSNFLRYCRVQHCCSGNSTSPSDY